MFTPASQVLAVCVVFSGFDNSAWSENTALPKEVVLETLSRRQNELALLPAALRADTA